MGGEGERDRHDMMPVLMLILRPCGVTEVLAPVTLARPKYILGQISVTL